MAYGALWCHLSAVVVKGLGVKSQVQIPAQPTPCLFLTLESELPENRESILVSVTLAHRLFLVGHLGSDTWLGEQASDLIHIV